MTYETELSIKSDILCAHDGLVTKFVAINHALQLAANKEYCVDDIANVLYDYLENFEEIPSNEFPNAYALL